MQEHREEFEPFVEDEVPFNEYCSAMREDGTWAGHMELQATSLVTGCNICIHQVKASHALYHLSERIWFTVGK
jgi:OTU domain-containing protein 3